MGRRAFLGLGANVGDREGNLREAVRRLSAAAGVNFARQSRVYETEPMGITDQPRFLNMVVEVEIGDAMSPRELLDLVKQIERDVGRTRRERWGPREIDIDVLLVGEERVKEGDFEVPHPRMWERAFVMAPLAELAPDVKGPTGETVSQIARRLGREQGLVALEDDRVG
jgi:2-amino-4-hydroxy-6-hydroxymethyldihydropteridine diphosphokinase